MAEDELGFPMAEVESGNHDDDLTNKVVGNAILTFQLCQRVVGDLDEIMALVEREPDSGIRLDG